MGRVKRLYFYNIANAKGQSGNDYFINLANILKTEYIDKGKTGNEAGEGFYKYPNPNYLKPDFSS